MENGIGRAVDCCGARKRWCCFCQIQGILDFAMQEITGNLSDNGENSARDLIMRVEALKAEKRRLKRR